MIALILIFISGCFEGFMDVLQFHYPKFEKKHKKADRLFWDAEISWANKYDENFKPKFFGSTTFFVSLTDGWHLFKMLRNVFLFSSLYFIELIWWFPILCYGINRMGFNLIYKIIYK